MKRKKMGYISFCMTMAKSILHTRDLRRKFGFYILIVLFVLFTLGVFLIGDWLESDIWLFTTYWAVVFVLTMVMIFLAMYDALRVVDEVRSEHNKEMAQDLRDLAELVRKGKEDQAEE